MRNFLSKSKHTDKPSYIPQPVLGPTALRGANQQSSILGTKASQQPSAGSGKGKLFFNESKQNITRENVVINCLL